MAYNDIDAFIRSLAIKGVVNLHKKKVEKYKRNVEALNKSASAITQAATDAKVSGKAALNTFFPLLPPPVLYLDFLADRYIIRQPNAGIGYSEGKVYTSFSDLDTMGIVSVHSNNYVKYVTDVDGYVRKTTSQYAPTIDHDPITNARLGASVDPKIYAYSSTPFNDLEWIKTATTITPSSVTSIVDGEQAYDLTADTQSFQHKIKLQFTSINSVYEIFASVWVKPRGYNYCHLTYNDTNAVIHRVMFDIATGQIVSTTGSAVGGIQKYMNGWYRIWIWATPDLSSTGQESLVFWYGPDPATTTYAGDNTSGVTITGMQVMSPYDALNALSYKDPVSYFSPVSSGLYYYDSRSIFIHDVPGTIDKRTVVAEYDMADRENQVLSFCAPNSNASISLGSAGDIKMQYDAIDGTWVNSTPINNSAIVGKRVVRLAIRSNNRFLKVAANGIVSGESVKEANIGDDNIIGVCVSNGNRATRVPLKVRRIWVYDFPLNDSQLAAITTPDLNY